MFSDTGRHVYYLLVKDKEGCSDSIAFNLQVGAQPKPVLSINDSVQCFNGNRFVFRTKSQQGIQNDWRINNKLIYSGNVDSTVYNETITGYHTVRLIQQTGSNCIDSITRKYLLLQKPIADFTINKDTQCLTGNSFEFKDASIANSDIVNAWTYQYNNQTFNGNAIQSNVQYNSTGSFKNKLNIGTKEGCSDSISKLIEVLSNPQARIIGDTICLNAVANISAIQTSGAPIQNWDWDFGDGFTGNKQQEQHTYASANSYSLSLNISDTKGCTAAITAGNAVLVHSLPDASFIYQELGDGVNSSKVKFLPILNSTNQYFWRFPNKQSSYLDTPVLIVDDLLKGTIILRVTNAYNCTDSSTQTIYVFPNNFNVYIPNAVTLNNDALNDEFKITGINNTQNFEMKIVNRWGEELFSSNDPTKGWDGRYQGELVPDGVYMYYVNFTYFDSKTYQFKGTITILK